MKTVEDPAGKVHRIRVLITALCFLLVLLFCIHVIVGNREQQQKNIVDSYLHMKKYDAIQLRAIILRWLPKKTGPLALDYILSHNYKSSGILANGYLLF